MTEAMTRTPNGQMPAYVAAPAGTGPWPGVVVVHDFAGMSHDLRNQAEWLASEGYLSRPPAAAGGLGAALRPEHGLGLLTGSRPGREGL
jgi:carboxymethylenebutenolidase